MTVTSPMFTSGAPLSDTVNVPPYPPATPPHPMALKIVQAVVNTLPKPAGYQLLVALYVRDNKMVTRSGTVIHLADQTIAEDKYQGKIGLVLDIGPDAFSEKDKFPSGALCKRGDWILWDALQHSARKFEHVSGTILAFVNDDWVRGTIADPTWVK